MINFKYYIFLIIMTLMGAFAGLFLKKASNFKNIKSLVFNVNIYIGGLLYFLSALINIYVLRFLDYSVVLPLTSITYIWTMIISYYVFKEKISSKKVVGVTLIILGAILIASF
ncbi:EamA family transporter [Clostridium butyricum]|uniref:EamA family transporter n=1 Tax=Clostridium butyricum TaxID=1492 RepID=UPI000ABB5FAA|nr:EamA family transporter [Clostridium butyricum]